MGTTETKKEETKIEKIAEDVAVQQKILEIPGFMDRGKKITAPVEQRGLKHIKVIKQSQNKWEILRKLDELIGLIISGEEPRSGEIRYILNQKDTSKSEKIRGVIKIK